jgi:hypothetical protein
MPISEERIAALEAEVELLREHLLKFMNSSTEVVKQVGDLAAENALLSRAVTFLGIFWNQDPRMPKKILADVHAA